MSDWIAIIGIVMSVLLAMVGLLVGVIGFLLSRYLGSLDRGMVVANQELHKIQTNMAGLTVKVEEQSECSQEMAQRLKKVEDHVNNQAQIAVMEQRLGKLDEDSKYYRNFGHWARNVFTAIAAKVPFEMPKEPVA